jgi:hypothetical protein
MQPATTSDNFTRLLTELLLNEITHTTTETGTRTRTDNIHTGNVDTGHENYNHTTYINTVYEFSRNYTDVISAYNTNIATYNDNMNRILHILERSPSAIRSRQLRNTPGYFPRNNVNRMPYTSAFRVNTVPASAPRDTLRDASGNHLRDASGNHLRDASGNHLRDVSGNPVSRTAATATSNLNSWYMRPFSNLIIPLLNNRDSNRTSGLSETQIREYTEEIVYDSSDAGTPTQCPISLVQFNEGDSLLRIRRCHHVFYPELINQWLRQHNTCPMCRRDVTVIRPPPENTSEVRAQNPPPTESAISTDDEMPELIDASDDESDDSPQHNSTNSNPFYDISTFNTDYTYVFEFPIQINTPTDRNWPSGPTGPMDTDDQPTE